MPTRTDIQEPYAEVVHVERSSGTVIIDFRIHDEGADHPIIDFDLSTIGKIDPRNWGDENHFDTGWVVIDLEQVAHMPSVGDRFFLD